ncbi:aspartyl protease family protein [Flammeovirgaceae bacterium SG7u.111]|nr:aspartyl protease family protein [Flammeovirgaceae bacterium SG7u.132]WPO35916.1 aspartyl protease family protein [Flammeovirgaceae bacterium SG7u.111]
MGANIYVRIRAFFITLIVFVFIVPAIAQQELGSFRLPKHKKTLTIPFELVHNLILIPLSINGSDTLRFILDTGVSTTVITSLPNSEDINLKYVRKLDLNGLGEGNSIQALYSTGNTLSIHDAIGYNHEVLFLLDDVFHLSASMGTYVHGLIGYDVFRNFIVEISYVKKKIYLHDPVRYNKKYRKMKVKWEALPISLEKEKPYITANILQKDSTKLNIKLLVDSGASHALSLYPITHNKLAIPDDTFRSFLGAGLSGEIFGYVGRVKELWLGNYNFTDPIVSYPDETSIQKVLDFSDRNGSLGSEILKRFRVVYHYNDKTILLKPNTEYKNAFRYNMSGIEVSTPIPGMPIYEISKVRANSPAKQAGLLKGDQIMMINGVKATRYSLNDIVSLFQSRDGRKIRLYIQRVDKTYKTEIVLQNKI